jgi:hypothetical protein
MDMDRDEMCTTKNTASNWAGLVHLGGRVAKGIWWRIRISAVHFFDRTGQIFHKTDKNIKSWFDKLPPTAPQALSGGPAPVIQHAAGYINPNHLTQHSMAPFDSTDGDLIVLYASSHEHVFLMPSDNFNNTWIALTGPTNSSNGIDLRSQIWYAKTPKVGPNHIFTMTLSARQSLVISLLVVRGSNVSDPIDAFSTIADDLGARTLTPMSPKITTTRSNDLLIGFGKSWSGKKWGAGGGFALQPAASSDFIAAEAGLAATPDSYNATFALEKPTNWQAAIVAVGPAMPSNTSHITLGWQPSSDNVGVIGYEVERCSGTDCEEFAQIGMSKYTSFVDWTVPTPGKYRYRVRAIDAASNVSDYSGTILITAGSAG